MGFSIVTYLKHEDDFWCKMGKFFAYRKYAKEMGGWQFYTKDKSVWFVSFLDGEIIGFNAIIHEKTHSYFDNFYVLPEFRGKGLSTPLFNMRLNYAISLKREIRVITDNPIQIKRYTDNNFIHYGMRGKYHKFKLYANKNSISQQHQ